MINDLNVIGNNVLVTLVKDERFSDMVRRATVVAIGDEVKGVNIGDHIIFYDLSGWFLDAKRMVFIVPGDKIIAVFKDDK